MNSFLSGFSHNYTGNVGAGYAGRMSGAGSSGMGSSTNGQGVDVTQLKSGDTFQGEIASVNGEDVQIQLANGQLMLAKLARDVQVAIGQTMNFQVQSNKDNHVVLKPVYDSSTQFLRVGEAALRAAGLPINEKNLNLVSSLLENGMSINKNTLAAYNRMGLQNPQVELPDIVKLTKLGLPVTEENARQLQSYQGMEHKLLDGISEAADELVRTYESLTEQGAEGVSLADGDKFMEQVLTIISGEEESAPLEQEAAVLDYAENGGSVSEENLEKNLEENPTENLTENKADASVISLTQEKAEALEQTAKQPLPTDEEAAENKTAENKAVNAAENEVGEKQELSDRELPKQEIPNREIPNQELNHEQNTAERAVTERTAQDEGQFKELVSQLRNETPETAADRVIDFLNNKSADIREIKQLLYETDIGKSLTPEQRDKIFRSEPFQTLLKNGLQRQWTIAPEEISKEGGVEELYQRIMKESSQLAKLINESLQDANAGSFAPQSRAMGNIAENVEFINQINQMFTYVQLPIKFSGSQAHGDLYVYTNRKNLARRDGLLTAFLHLDMEHLGALDVSIALELDKNQVTTKFYIDEASIDLVEEHIGELGALFEKNGYHSKNSVLQKEEDKTALEHIEEQLAAGSAAIGYQSFDTRA